jgi:hypothetical protein
MPNLIDRIRGFLFRLTRQMKTASNSLFLCQFIENLDRLFIRYRDELDGQFRKIRFKIFVRYHSSAHPCPDCDDPR